MPKVIHKFFYSITGNFIVTNTNPSIENDKATLDDVQNCPGLVAVNFTDEIVYKCERCPRQYMHQKPFVKHLKTEHGISYKSVPTAKKRRSTSGTITSGGKRSTIACAICQMEYSSITVLKKHELRHGEF